jgi:hypothetical protein
VAERVVEGARHLPATRTREQDALALLDEGGVALLCATGALEEARGALDRREAATIARLVAAGSALGVVYGHAVYEHLGCGGPPVRAMTHLVACPAVPASAEECVARCDEALAGALADLDAFTRPEDLRSLPVEAEVLGAR